MAKVSTYLNFPGTTEEAFNFYKTIFGGEFQGELNRFRDMPTQEGMPAILEKDLDLIVHVALPILGGHVLMGTDAPASMGFNLIEGNTMYINLEPDTREETDRLFNELSAGGKIGMPLQEMFWGDYYGFCVDKFGINWMFNCSKK